ncbi:MAG: ParB N-terminal domain-containing protein [Verrucomicrobiota bacterium]
MKPISKRTITYRPLEGLTIHPAIKSDPRLDNKDPRYVAMQNAWRESGVLPPILVTPDGQIVDGRHRFWFAQKEELEEAPCVEVTEEEVPMVILQGLAGRNHVTKGQRAYLAAPRLEQAFEAAQQRRIQVLQTAGKVKLPVIPTVEELAERLGIGRDLLFQARKIHAAFADEKTGKAFRKEWEPRILDAEEPVGLGAVLQGIGGAKATKGKDKKPARNSALNNFLANWKNLTRPAAHWTKWTEIEREQVDQGIRTAVAKLPPEVLAVITAAVRAARRAQVEAEVED